MHMLSSEPTRRAISEASTDIELASKASAGNSAAFETIVRRSNHLLLRTARGIVPDDEEAQDVVQETYLRAFANLRSFRGDSSLATWLVRIAINVALAARRKNHRLVQMQETETPAVGAFSEEDKSSYTPDAEGPRSRAERREVRALLQASIENLPIIYRAVFILRAVEERTVEETAFCLCISEDVVKTRFLRARTLLRKMLTNRIETTAPDAFTFG